MQNTSTPNETIYYKTSSIVDLVETISVKKSYSQLAIFLDTQYAKRNKFGFSIRVLKIHTLDDTNKTVEVIIPMKKIIYSCNLSKFQESEKFNVCVIKLEQETYNGQEYYPSKVFSVAQSVIADLQSISKKQNQLVFDFE